MTRDDEPVFSFVLPAYNERPNLEHMTRRLVEVGEGLGKPFEILWVNDGSTDGTDEALDELAEADGRIRAIHFTRNFGHMAALTAGLEGARATGAVICMDADGQHPPELIPEMVKRWRDGHEIVQTVKTKMGGETALQRGAKKLFIQIMKRLAEVELPEGAADFRLLDREAVDAINGLPERVRFVRGLVCWVGFRTETIEFEAPDRHAGERKYTLWSLFLLAINGITSFSTRPLRISLALGFAMTSLAFLYATFVLGAFFLGVELEPRGWSSTLVTIVGIGGMQLVALGIVSEYLARLYTEVKNRPVYLARRPSRKKSAG